MANTINITVDKASMSLDQVNNTSDLNKPISTATQTALNGKEDVSNKSTNTSLGTSDTLYPTQNAVKVYTDNLLGNANALVYKGTIDCSTNPNYPSANAGELYIVSVAGKIGGVSGVNVEAGDMLICNTDSTVSGDEATVGAYWSAIQKNIDGAVIGPAISANNKVAVFDGVTGKLLKMGIMYDNGTNVGIGTASATSKLHVVGDVNITTIENATTNTDKFLVSDSGVVKHRTASQLKSDLTLDQVNNTSDVNKPISSATQTALDNKSDKNITLDRKTASYILVANDNGKMIEMNVASANTLTINASLFSAGNQILISQYGAGQTTITAGAGVTLRSSGGKLKTSAQYSLVTIVAISSTEFYVAGDLTA